MVSLLEAFNNKIESVEGYEDYSYITLFISNIESVESPRDIQMVIPKDVVCEEIIVPTFNAMKGDTRPTPAVKMLIVKVKDMDVDNPLEVSMYDEFTIVDKDVGIHALILLLDKVHPEVTPTQIHFDPETKYPSRLMAIPNVYETLEDIVSIEDKEGNVVSVVKDTNQWNLLNTLNYINTVGALGPKYKLDNLTVVYDKDSIDAINALYLLSAFISVNLNDVHTVSDMSLATTKYVIDLSGDSSEFVFGVDDNTITKVLLDNLILAQKLIYKEDYEPVELFSYILNISADSYSDYDVVIDAIRLYLIDGELSNVGMIEALYDSLKMIKGSASSFQEKIKSLLGSYYLEAEKTSKDIERLFELTSFNKTLDNDVFYSTVDNIRAVEIFYIIKGREIEIFNRRVENDFVVFTLHTSKCITLSKEVVRRYLPSKLINALLESNLVTVTHTGDCLELKITIEDLINL